MKEEFKKFVIQASLTFENSEGIKESEKKLVLLKDGLTNFPEESISEIPDDI